LGPLPFFGIGINSFQYALEIFILNLVDGVRRGFSPALLAALTAFCKLLVNTGCSKLLYNFRISLHFLPYL